MLDERIARGLASALTAVGLLIAPAYIFSGLELARTALLFGLLCAAIGIAAGLLLGRKNPALQIAAASLPAAALALFGWPGVPMGGALFYAVMGAGALLSVWAERLTATSSAKPARPGLLMMPLLALLACAVLILFTGPTLPKTGEALTLVIVPGAIWFAVSIILQNNIALRNAARSQNGFVPQGVRRAGFLGAAVFVAVTVLLACMGPIVQFIGEAVRRLILWAFYVFDFFAGLFSRPPAAEQPDQSAVPMETLPPAEGKPSPLMEAITQVLIVLVLVATAAAILYGLYRLVPKLWKKLIGRLRGVFATWHDEEGYSDRTESLMSLRQALSGAGDRFRKFARRFRRKERIGDFPTNAGKARFLFREYLRSLSASRRDPPPGATATEIAKPVPALSQAYNPARYGGAEPGDGDITAAQEALRTK